MSFGEFRDVKRSELHITHRLSPESSELLDKHRQVSWLSTLLIRLPVPR
jgi:hypothetical protein